MGTHGVGLFQDDTAQDVRDEFLRLLRQGHTVEEASVMLLSRWTLEIDDVDDGPTFWLALAATQSEYGCLQPEIKDRAVAIIDDGAGLGRWSGEQRERRSAMLMKLRNKLLGAQPKARKPRQLKQFEPVPRHEAAAPDGRGKAVAFGVPGAAFMQVCIERLVDGSRGGGSVFVAVCAYDEVTLAWMPGPNLVITYPANAVVQQQDSEHFFRGETIPVFYQTSGRPSES